MVDLDRQERPERTDAAGRRLVPSRVPEERPPLLGDWFIYFSVVVLVCGVVAITALELGTPLDSGIVRVPALIGAGLLVVLSADAALRVWRSAWAWLPVDRGRGAFRLVWAAVLVGILLLSIGAIVYFVTV
jgi:hypothetical protein